MNHNLFIATNQAVKTEKSWVVKMHVVVKRVLRPFVLSILPHSTLGGTKYSCMYVVSRGIGPGWRTSSLWYLRIPLLFIHIPPAQSQRSISPQYAPPPFLLLHFDVNGWMNGCSWPIKRPALLKGLGDWDSARPHHLYPPPTRHFVLTPLATVSAHSSSNMRLMARHKKSDTADSSQRQQIHFTQRSLMRIGKDKK